MLQNENIDLLEDLKIFLTNKFSNITCIHMNDELIIKGKPIDYQHVRNALYVKKIPVSVIRDEKHKTIKEIRISLIDIKEKNIKLQKPRLLISDKPAVVKVVKISKPKPEKPPKSPKPEVIIIKKVVIKKEKIQPQPLPQELVMCKHLNTEVRFLNQKLQEEDFVKGGKKLRNRLGKKVYGIFRYVVLVEYYQELINLFIALGYSKDQVKLLPKTSNHRGCRVVVLYLNNRPDKKMPTPKVPKKVLKFNSSASFLDPTSREYVLLNQVPIDVLIKKLVSYGLPTVKRTIRMLRKELVKLNDKSAPP